MSAVAGGDSSPRKSNVSKKAADDSEEEDSAAAYVAAERHKFEDPGDRETPLERERGNPWEPNLSDLRRAARLEGRKVISSTLAAGMFHESLYRIDRFRQFLPKRGSNGLGLAQWWGPRATRKYRAGEPKPDWEVQTDRKLHTVNVGDINFHRS